MGYTTKFNGSFKINPHFNDVKKLNAWLHQRHIVLDIDNLCISDLDVKDYLMWGDKILDGGANFIYSRHFNILSWINDEFSGATKNFNVPPAPCPSLWSDLKVSEDGSELSWNGMEKTYCMVEWLELLLKYIFIPNDYILDGEFSFQGENDDDHGNIVIAKNNLKIL